ncbi:MAG: MBL fold metallo-hydrolase [Anaerolineales bacterium]|nr:MBL fold metallo-hydrolase [Anaerolineales bacterium]
MEVTFHGAAQTVTGSQHLISVGGRRILLDCGLYQGKRSEANYRNRHFLYPPGEVDALVLSHAHIDHSGLIPNLTRQGFRGPIHATHATRDLCEYMLRDSGRIQEADAEYLNRRARKRGQPEEFVPLYTEQDAEAALTQFDGHRYKQPFQVAPGVRATFLDAGHMLGSASVVLEMEEGGRILRLGFSGDIGRMNLPILRDPTLLRDVDVAIMESTYGGRSHQAPEAAFAELTEVVTATVARGGRIIIPSFAVGRAQEIVYELNRLIQAGEIPPLPVFVDSPLAIDVSDVFREHEELYDQETRRFMRQNGSSPLQFSSLTYTRSVEESKAINEVKGPAIIISTSGMAESGRILHHLRNNIEDPRNTILIVSWQAEHTLGRRLADQAKEVNIFGDPYKVRAQVVTINGYSGHAGHDLLVRWAKALKPRVKQVFLVHGEPPALNALRLALHVEGLPNVVAPQLHETHVV